VSSTLASCTDASFSAVFRYARRTFAAWPGDLFARAIASFLAFLARQRSWVFLRPSQVCSRGRVSRHLWRSGPTCRFARRASDPIDFSRADRSRAWWRRGRPRTFSFCATFDFWASLPSAIRIPKQRATGPILPRALPLAGLWTRVCACDRARPRSNHQPPGSRGPLIVANPRVPIRSWVFNSCADCEPAKKPSLQRIDGADALSA
jgi:hypothetical protein